ncbi:cytoplasmic protein [Arthrobacter sp. RHLT1-20]
MSQDPVASNPRLYRVVFENERVRVLEYTDTPGDKTVEHHHPDSVMITLSTFRRRLSGHGDNVDVEIPSGTARWLPAQDHSGTNIGDTATHTMFVELKEPAPAQAGGREPLGPAAG